MKLPTKKSLRKKNKKTANLVKDILKDKKITLIEEKEIVNNTNNNNIYSFYTEKNKEGLCLNQSWKRTARPSYYED